MLALLLPLVPVALWVAAFRWPRPYCVVTHTDTRATGRRHLSREWYPPAVVTPMGGVNPFYLGAPPDARGCLVLVVAVVLLLLGVVVYVASQLT